MQYTISQIASAAGVNRETVRYYEKRGLLPEPQRNSSGYRVYTPEDLQLIHFIKSSQSLGFTLDEIDELLKLPVSSDTLCSDVRQKVGEKLDVVRSKINQLQKIERVLNDLKSSCDDPNSSSCPILKSLESADFF